MNKKPPLIEVTNLHQVFKTPEGRVQAVNGVSFSMQPGETVGLVGESGSGKSTVAELLVRSQKPTEGRIIFKGQDVTRFSDRKFRPLRKQMRMVHQDLTRSFNPRATVAKILDEPLRLHNIVPKNERPARILELLERVDLDPGFLTRRPDELSGGQRQRVGIARAIATGPEFIVLDEPTSSLDMSLRIQIMALLQQLQAEMGLAYLFISHDLSTVRHLCSRVMIMSEGKIVEDGTVQRIFVYPQHPETQALVEAGPIPNPTRRQARRHVPIESNHS